MILVAPNHERCLEPDGKTVCQFAENCWPSIQRLAQQLGHRGMKCPHYALALQAESYERPEGA